MKNIKKIRIEQFKSKQSSNVDTDTQSEVFDEHNTIVLPYFDQISKTIQFMLKKFKIHTISRIPFGRKVLIILGKDVWNKFEKSDVVYKLNCKKCKVTYVGQTGRLLNTRVEEHKKNLGRKCNYHNVLSDHRKEYADRDFDWNNVEILHSESNKGKRELQCSALKLREDSRYCETINILLNAFGVIQVLNRERRTKNCYNFVLSFMEESSASHGR